MYVLPAAIEKEQNSFICGTEWATEKVYIMEKLLFFRTPRTSLSQHGASALEYIQSQNYHFCTCFFCPCVAFIYILCSMYMYVLVYFWLPILLNCSCIILIIRQINWEATIAAGITLFFADILGSALADGKRHMSILFFYSSH